MVIILYLWRFAGKIKTVALTNFDTKRLEIILENGIPVVSNQVIFEYHLPFFSCKFLCCFVHVQKDSFQVQHSIVDMRPQQRMAQLCELTGVKLIT